jgi:hypothetical protein
MWTASLLVALVIVAQLGGSLIESLPATSFDAASTDDICNTASDCMACTLLSPDCVFCADPANPGEAEHARDRPSIGGWIFKQRGLDDVADGNKLMAIQQDARTSKQRRRSGQPDAIGVEHNNAAAESLHDNTGVEAASRELAGIHLMLELPASLPRYSSRACYNATFSTTVSRVCMDARSDVCDCDGDTVSALPACAMVVTEVRTPVYAIAAAMVAALAIVAGAVSWQLKYAHCCKRY